MSDRIHLDKREPVEVEIPADLLAKLEGVADSHSGTIGRVFTAEEDAAILAYYPVKNKDELAAVFSCCAETLRKRYNKLIAMEENNGND